MIFALDFLVACLMFYISHRYMPSLEELSKELSKEQVTNPYAVPSFLFHIVSLVFTFVGVFQLSCNFRGTTCPFPSISYTIVGAVLNFLCEIIGFARDFALYRIIVGILGIVLAVYLASWVTSAPIVLAGEHLTCVTLIRIIVFISAWIILISTLAALGGVYIVSGIPSANSHVRNHLGVAHRVYDIAAMMSSSVNRHIREPQCLPLYDLHPAFKTNLTLVAAKNRECTLKWGKAIESIRSEWNTGIAKALDEVYAVAKERDAIHDMVEKTCHDIHAAV